MLGWLGARGGMVGDPVQSRVVLLSSSAPAWATQGLRQPHHWTEGIHLAPGMVGGHKKYRCRRRGCRHWLLIGAVGAVLEPFHGTQGLASSIAASLAEGSATYPAFGKEK